MFVCVFVWSLDQTGDVKKDSLRPLSKGVISKKLCVWKRSRGDAGRVPRDSGELARTSCVNVGRVFAA